MGNATVHAMGRTGWIAAWALGALAGGTLAMACTRSSVDTEDTDDAGSESDTGPSDARSTADAGAFTVKITRPTPGEEFSATDRITLAGTATDPIEGDIGKAADAKQRMIWMFGIDDRSVNPAGEGPTDDIGAGTDHPLDGFD